MSQTANVFEIEVEPGWSRGPRKIDFEIAWNGWSPWWDVFRFAAEFGLWWVV